MEVTRRDVREVATSATSVMSQLNAAFVDMSIAFQCAARSIVETMQPILREFSEWIETEKRAVLFSRLPTWIPLRVRTWIADVCPRRWLPRLFFEKGEPDA